MGGDNYIYQRADFLENLKQIQTHFSALPSRGNEQPMLPKWEDGECPRGNGPGICWGRLFLLPTQDQLTVSGKHPPSVPGPFKVDILLSNLGGTACAQIGSPVLRKPIERPD